MTSALSSIGSILYCWFDNTVCTAWLLFSALPPLSDLKLTWPCSSLCSRLEGRGVAVDYRSGQLEETVLSNRPCQPLNF